jgi:nicotinate-nucleotide adenylyltransferase
VLVVGGTFDPPHAGHVALVAAWRDAEAPGDALLFVPAATSPFKVGRSQTPGEQRLDMLRLAIAGTARAAVWADEIRRAGVGEASFTVDTLERLRRVAPVGTRFGLVMGADQLAQFHRWREPGRILELAEIVVLMRPPMVERDVLRATLGAELDPLSGERAWSAGQIELWLAGAVRVDARYEEISSSAIRARVATGGVEAVPEGWIEPGVRQYIRTNGLYRDGHLPA